MLQLIALINISHIDSPEEAQRGRASTIATIALALAIADMFMSLACGLLGSPALIVALRARKLGYRGSKTFYTIFISAGEVFFDVFLIVAFIIYELDTGGF